MKRKFLILLCGILLIGITGCGTSENDIKEDEQIIIEEFDIAEGCYSKENDNGHIVCFTSDLAYHDVLYKDGVYYNDPYYMVSPPTEEKTTYYKFTYSDNKVLKLEYYTDNELCYTDVCYAIGTKVLKCTRAGDDMIIPNGKYEFNLNKIDKEFNKEIIESLPLYERNKEFDLIFNNETITCNLTRRYSLINSMSSSDIKECLQKHYNKEYNVTEIDQTGNWYIYSSDSVPSDLSSKKDISSVQSYFAYIQSHFAYTVTVNDKTFGYANAFPVDPYSTDKKMIVKAVKNN